MSVVNVDKWERTLAIKRVSNRYHTHLVETVFMDKKAHVHAF